MRARVSRVSYKATSSSGCQANLKLLSELVERLLQTGLVSSAASGQKIVSTTHDSAMPLGRLDPVDFAPHSKQKSGLQCNALIGKKSRGTRINRFFSRIWQNIHADPRNWGQRYDLFVTMDSGIRRRRRDESRRPANHVACGFPEKSPVRFRILPVQ